MIDVLFYVSMYLAIHFLAGTICYGCNMAFWRTEWPNIHTFREDEKFSALLSYLAPFPGNFIGCMLSLTRLGYRPWKHGFKLF